MTNYRKLIQPNLKIKETIVYVVMGSISGILGICLTYLAGHFLDVVITSKMQSGLFYFIILYVILTIVNKGCGVLLEYQRLSLEAALSYQISRNALKKIYATSYLNYCKENPASISQIINSDSSEIAGFYISFFKNIFVQTISLAIYLVVLVRSSVLIGLSVVLMTGVYTFIYLLTKKAMYRSEKEVIETRTEYATTLFSLLEKSVSIRLNGVENQHFKKLEQEYQGLYHALKKQTGVYNRYSVSKGILVLIFQSTLFAVGGRMVQHEQLSVGTLIVMMNYFVYVLGCIEYFLNIGSSYQSVKTCEDRLKKYMDFEDIPTGSEVMERIENISLNGLSFAYPGKKVLFEITEELYRGQLYWIKGKNGAGKSSLMNLMLGVYGNAYKGEIQYNHVKIDEMNLKRFIEKNTAVVEQSPYVFQGTVRENITLKAGSAKEKDMEELTSRMKLKQFWGSVENDKVQCAKNVTYSGGEKQKIALVRLLLSDACIWILDEPTSNLDKESKICFYNELECRKKNHITILISHEKPLCKYDGVIEWNG